MFDEITEISLLCDFYGNLLTEKQRQVVILYHEENFSLAEIAGEYNISRQGVYDTLKNGEKALKGYEEKLGLVKRFADTVGAVQSIDEIIDRITIERKSDKELVERLDNIKKIINKLND